MADRGGLHLVGQLAVFVGGYLNLLAWQRKARAKMDETEGRIECRFGGRNPGLSGRGQRWVRCGMVRGVLSVLAYAVCLWLIGIAQWCGVRRSCLWF